MTGKDISSPDGYKASVPSSNSAEFGGSGSGSVEDLYESWFLDYASYVILDRAVPNIYDGLKPVQRRLLHAMHELEDGRYNKAANIIGHTMRYHPHGDMAIEDALVKMAQKELLIDTQGNWGNPATGDRAAAPRYIEARLTKFAKEILFKEDVTDWQRSYDGRNQEPVGLPVKFPLLLVTGVEGIAVGLSTKVLPHNFNEVIQQAIQHLKGNELELYPDFLSGGLIDVERYDGGRRGGKVKIRANLEIVDQKSIRISEIPYGTTTTSLIDSILSANEKGKLRIKKVEDNTAETVEIMVHLPTGVSPHSCVDALYAFSDCEISISPSCCVIRDAKPYFCSVEDLLRESVDYTLEILERELRIEKESLEEKIHLCSLEIIFIDKKIYRKIENSETWEEVLTTLHKAMKPYTKDVLRTVQDDDLTKLTEIKIKRISKFDRQRADENLIKLQSQLKDVEAKLANLVDTAIAYFTRLQETYGGERQRRTKIESFEIVEARAVAAVNQKLYINRVEGFIGTSLKKDELLLECSDLDEIIAFTEEGCCMVSKVSDKTFFGKHIIYAGLFTRGDEATVYHLLYQDGRGGSFYKKRFNLPAVTRDRVYDLSRGTKGSKVWHFSANPQGEGEVVELTLKPGARSSSKIIDVDFGDMDIKTRAVKGLLVTKEPVASVEVVKREEITERPQDIWFDPKTRRLNHQRKGKHLGAFAGDDSIFTLYKGGAIELSPIDIDAFFDENILHIGKFSPEIIVSIVYFHGEKRDFYVKRFKLDELSLGKREEFIPPLEGTKLLILSLNPDPCVQLNFNKGRRGTPDPEQVYLSELVQPKGVRALGNKVSRLSVKSVKLAK